MSAVTKMKLTEAEYLAREEANSFRSEFYNGEMFAMVGGNATHNRIIENLSIRLGGKLWGSECQTYSSDQRVKIDDSGLYTYPDFVVVCGKPEYTTPEEHTLANPRVIFEVLSPSTELYDRTTKFEHYKKVLSLSEYVLVSPNKPFIEQFVRQADHSWLYQSFEGLDHDFQLASLKVNVPMAEIFARVEFSQTNEALRLAYPDADQPNP